MPLIIDLGDDVYKPNNAEQAAFLDDYTNPFIAAAGGWRAGKTWVGGRKLVNLHLYNAGVLTGKLTGVDSLAVAQSYQAAQTVVIPELRKALEESNLRYRFHGDMSRFWFELFDLRAGSDHSLIYVRTAERPETIAGFEVGAIWGDEVARWRCDRDDPLKNPVLQCMGRLADWRAAFRQFMMTFTHEGDSTSVYQDFEGEPKPGHKLYRLPTSGNPLMADYVEQQKRQLTPDLAKQYLEGYAVNLRGSLVFDNFSDQPGRNVDDTLALDVNYPLQLAMDFNVDPGSHVCIGQYFPDRQLVTTVYELYEDRMDTKHFVNVVWPKFMREFLDPLKMVRPGGWRFPGRLELFGDPSGNNKNLATGESCWEVLAAGLNVQGVPFTAENVPSGVVHVADRVNSTNCAFMNADGEIRYKIHPRCKRLLHDYKALKWQGNEIDKRDKKKSHSSEADSHRVYQLLPITKIVVSGGTVGTY